MSVSGFPPALLVPAHVAIAVMTPRVIVLGMLAPPRGGLLGIPPGMPVACAVPIAVAIAEGYSAAGANGHRDIVSHRGLACADGAAEQAESDERRLDWGFHDSSSLIINIINA